MIADARSIELLRYRAIIKKPDHNFQRISENACAVQSELPISSKPHRMRMPARLILHVSSTLKGSSWRFKG